MSAKIFETRPSWVAVATAASERLGRKYSGVYCREVAIGFRGNAKLEPVLQELGVMEKPKATKQPRAKRAIAA